MCSILWSGFVVFYNSWLLIVNVEIYLGFMLSLWIWFMGIDSVLVIFVGVSFCIVVLWLLGIIFI